MTFEEKIAAAKALHEAGITEIVFEKNVEYEIDKVENGGIGVQINYGSPADKAIQESASKKVTKRIESPKLVSTTFTYRWLKEYPVGIVKFYQALLKGGFIDPDTKPGDFGKIFMGKDCDVKIKFIGKKAHLWYMFSLIFERQYVSWPSGVGQWIIVQSHFLDNKSKVFLDFNSQHTPKSYANTLSSIVEVLNPASECNQED